MCESVCLCLCVCLSVCVCVRERERERESERVSERDRGYLQADGGEGLLERHALKFVIVS